MKEKISTLLDDELDLKGTSQAVSEIINDNRLRERFETYQLIRDSMKNELSDATFSSKSILDAIDKSLFKCNLIRHRKQRQQWHFHIRLGCLGRWLHLLRQCF